MNWQTIIEFLGGAAAISAVLGYLGKKAIDSFAAGRLEFLKNELELLSNEHRDSLTRQRDVYGRVATSLRVFISGHNADSGAREAFHSAYAACWLWAPDSVIESLNRFIQMQEENSAHAGTHPMEEMKKAYGKIVIAMRRDAGYDETSLGDRSYKFVRF